jgi:hypothetical protein
MLRELKTTGSTVKTAVCAAKKNIYIYTKKKMLRELKTTGSTVKRRCALGVNLVNLSKSNMQYQFNFAVLI